MDFDPEKIPYERLLDIFWASHDPTSKSWSRQYKAVIFYHDEEQKNMAAATRDRLAAKLGTKIHTEILPYDAFYLAEPYHQKYRLRSVREIMTEFNAMYPLDDDFVNSTAVGHSVEYVSPPDMRRFLLARTWYLTLSGATIYGRGPREMIVSEERKRGWKNFPQLGLILEYCSTQRAHSYWFGLSGIGVNANKRSYWAKSAFEVFVRDWSTLS